MRTTKDITVPEKVIDQVLGQDAAVQIIRKASQQRRHVLLIGEPGTGKSMLGIALAELLPRSDLRDIISLPNVNDENNPLIKTTPAGKGREEVKQGILNTKQMLRNNNVLLFLVALLTFIAPWWVRHYYKSDLMFTAFFLGGMLFLAAFAIMLSMGQRMFKAEQVIAPKLIVDNFGKKHAPFFDATGAHAGALLGDVLHDPYQCFLPGQMIMKSNTPYGLTAIDREIDALIEKYPERVVTKKDYEAVFLPKNELTLLGEADGSLSPVEVVSCNRHNYEGILIKLTTSEGKELIVTPEHKVAIEENGSLKYVEARSIKISDTIVSASILVDEHKLTTQTITKIERFHYKGKLYNVTTSSGNVVVNGVLCKNSGGLGTPANQRVVAGMIHKAHLGVLFIDEIATLDPRTQQELLSALQEKKFPITGQSERSAGAMVRTEAVPCDFVLVAAGNLETIKHMHPALRSRIRGYGYEVYMKETMLDTSENRGKIAKFIAQEVKKENGKIPHFDKSAITVLIEEARRMANRKGHLTLHLRGLGGLVRAAGDLAREEGVDVVTKRHVKDAKVLARPLEQQIADDYIEKKKQYEVIVTEGRQIGRVNGLAVIGGGSAYSGILLPIEAEVTIGGKKSEFIATGKLGEIAKEAITNVSAIILKYFGEDLKEKYDVFVQFLQTYEGVEGDSASIAVATAIISAFKKIPVRQDIAMTGSLSVRGEVLPVGGVSSKVEAAIDAGIKTVIVPKANLQDIVIEQDKLNKVVIVPVTTIEEVLDYALDWGGNKNVKEKILNGRK